MLFKCIIVIWLHQNIISDIKYNSYSNKNLHIITFSVQLFLISLLLIKKTKIIIRKIGSTHNNEKSRLHSSKTLDDKTLPSGIGNMIRYIC